MLLIWVKVRMLTKGEKSLRGNHENGKVRPRTGHESPDKEQGYNSTLSLTLALDGGGWLTPRFSHFTPGKDMESILKEAGWAPGLV
jgi:hypothetical protein